MLLVTACQCLKPRQPDAGYQAQNTGLRLLDAAVLSNPNDPQKALREPERTGSFLLRHHHGARLCPRLPPTGREGRDGAPDHVRVSPRPRAR